MYMVIYPAELYLHHNYQNFKARSWTSSPCRHLNCDGVEDEWHVTPRHCANERDAFTQSLACPQ
jgi:hypothetical protein